MLNEHATGVLTALGNTLGTIALDRAVSNGRYHRARVHVNAISAGINPGDRVQFELSGEDGDYEARHVRPL